MGAIQRKVVPMDEPVMIIQKGEVRNIYKKHTTIMYQCNSCLCTLNPKNYNLLLKRLISITLFLAFALQNCCNKIAKWQHKKNRHPLLIFAFYGFTGCLAVNLQVWGKLRPPLLSPDRFRATGDLQR